MQRQQILLLDCREFGDGDHVLVDDLRETQHLFPFHAAGSKNMCSGRRSKGPPFLRIVLLDLAVFITRGSDLDEIGPLLAGIVRRGEGALS